jgi:hypothetical protein
MKDQDRKASESFWGAFAVAFPPTSLRLRTERLDVATTTGQAAHHRKRAEGDIFQRKTPPLNVQDYCHPRRLSQAYSGTSLSCPAEAVSPDMT